MRDRRDHRGGPSPARTAGDHGARARAGEERQRHAAADRPPGPSPPGPGGRPAHLRVRQRRAAGAVRRAREPRTVQVKKTARGLARRAAAYPARGLVPACTREPVGRRSVRRSSNLRRP